MCEGGGNNSTKSKGCSIDTQYYLQDVSYASPTLFTIAYSSFNGLKQYVPTTCLIFSFSGRTLGVIPLLEAKYASVTYWHVFMDSATSTSPSVIYFFEEKDDLY